MSRASQRNAWLIQHCFSPYGTTQLEKTGKKGSFGPQKAPIGVLEVLGGPRGGRFDPNYPRLARLGAPDVLGEPRGADLVPTTPDWPAWIGFMVTTHFDLVSGPFHSPIFIGLHSVSISANMHHLNTFQCTPGGRRERSSVLAGFPFSPTRHSVFTQRKQNMRLL